MAHFTDEDIAYFQSKVDEMWEKWLIPGVIPPEKGLQRYKLPARSPGLRHRWIHSKQR